jgi:hypothetical protein
MLKTAYHFLASRLVDDSSDSCDFVGEVFGNLSSRSHD